MSFADDATETEPHRLALTFHCTRCGATFSRPSEDPSAEIRRAIDRGVQPMALHMCEDSAEGIGLLTGSSCPHRTAAEILAAKAERAA